MNTIKNMDCIAGMKELPDNSIDCCVTSPPYYGLRDYGHEGQIGLEETPEQYVSKMVEVFEHVRRVLKPEGTLWLNLGDSYSSHKDCKSIGQSLAKGTSRETAHFATFPEDLIVDCIKAGCPEGGIILDPFGGAGTTAVVARKLNRNYLLYELNPDYIKIAEKRIFNSLGIFA